MNKSGRGGTIVLTGGGSAGHVIPNLIILPELLADGWNVHYIGSKGGIEESLTRRDGITYHSVLTGKMRRYMDLKNLSDPFRVAGGIAQAVRLLSKIKPRVIFSKGGYVAVPVLIGGALTGVSSVIHESDRTQGLATKIGVPFASRVCCSFSQTLAELPRSAARKGVYTGAPVRPELLLGDAAEGLRMCGFDKQKPVLLAVGGSLGSTNLNRIVRGALPELLKRWQVAHICGKNNVDASLAGQSGYAQFEFVGDELAHLFKISRAAVSRAGSNAIFELLRLKIPSVLIPLPLSASRGDQLLNAREFEQKGYCVRLEEARCNTPDALPDAVNLIEREHDRFVAAMSAADIPDAKELILDEIYRAANMSRGR